MHQLWNGMLKIIKIDFDDSWQKYSKCSRPLQYGFACFSSHVGLLVITLSSLKLYTENNVCMFHLEIVKKRRF